MRAFVIGIQSSKSVVSIFRAFEPIWGTHVRVKYCEEAAHKAPDACLLLDGGASTGTLPPKAGVMLARDCEAVWAEELHERIRSREAARWANDLPDDRSERRVVHDIWFIIHRFCVAANR